MRKVLANKPEFKQATYPSGPSAALQKKPSQQSRTSRVDPRTTSSTKQQGESVNKESVLTFKADAHPSPSRFQSDDPRPKDDNDRIGKKFFDGGLDIPAYFGAFSGQFGAPVAVEAPVLSPIPYRIPTPSDAEPYPAEYSSNNRNPQYASEIPKNRFVQSKVFDDVSKTPSKHSQNGADGRGTYDRSRSASQTKRTASKVRTRPDKTGNSTKPVSARDRNQYANTERTSSNLKDASQRSPSPLTKSKLKITPIEQETYNRLLKRSGLAASGVNQFNEELSRPEEVPTFQPEINKKSQILADQLTRGNYDNVHQRLFHQGVESLHRKQVRHEHPDPTRYPFKPLTNHPSPKRCLTRADIERFATGGTEKSSCKREASKPVVSKSPRKTSAPKHKYTLAEVEAFRQQQKVYKNYLLQVFDFLDYRHTGLLHASTLRTELIEDTLREMLGPVIEAVVQHNKFLDYQAFCGLVDKSDLSHVIYKVFGFVDAFPGVKHIPSVQRKEFKFK